MTVSFPNDGTPAQPAALGVQPVIYDDKGNPAYAINAPVVNQNAYASPVGNQGNNWQAGMQNYLGATTGNAPQMGYTSAGNA